MGQPVDLAIGSVCNDEAKDKAVGLYSMETLPAVGVFINARPSVTVNTKHLWKAATISLNVCNTLQEAF